MNLVAIDKPEGITTHQSEANDLGIIEFVSYQRLMAQQNKQGLYVVHRLDKETSGVLLAAEDPETARVVTEKFQSHEIKKRYLFLTDRSTKQKTFEIQSHIEREKNTYISHQNKVANSETRFNLIWQHGVISLWEALPKTGKSHQIRLHANDVGLPILGDNLHNGSPWSRLCLHADQISLDKTYHAIPPWWSLEENAILVARSLAGDSSAILLTKLKIAYEKRRRLKLTENSCYRLSHEESHDFTVDIFQEVGWVNWYREKSPDKSELEIIQSFFKDIGKSALIKHRFDRGKDPNSNAVWSFGEIPEDWQVIENGINYQVRSDQGLSAGLFLDQKMNRKWVYSEAKNLKVLNLFSYTCGFSVAAALGSAQEICSVDTSQKFLDWGKVNFDLNKLHTSKYEFWSQDSLLFLKGAIKRARKFDLIIVDPPSFGRSKSSVFRIEKDWDFLLDQCLQVLSSHGQILFSTNFEKWSTNDFMEIINAWAKKNKLTTTQAPLPELDFELSTKNRLLKSILIKKTF